MMMLMMIEWKESSNNLQHSQINWLLFLPSSVKGAAVSGVFATKIKFVVRFLGLSFFFTCAPLDSNWLAATVMHGHANAVWALRQRPDRQSRLDGTGKGRGQVGQPDGREWPTGRVQWMNESLAKGANGQQSCWHTDHTHSHSHTHTLTTTCCHTYTVPHTHTWDANKSAAFAVSRSSAWLGFALMLCCILYGVLGTLRVCQLPVARCQ